MSKVWKLKWAYKKYKSKDSKESPIQVNPLQSKKKNTFSNGNYLNLISVYFMIEKFDSFDEQLNEILSKIKQLREENLVLK